MYKQDCEMCETEITVFPTKREVLANGKTVEMLHLSDIGLIYECPACGYEQSVWDEFNE